MTVISRLNKNFNKNFSFHLDNCENSFNFVYRKNNNYSRNE